jgi:uncharacterized membrane protein YgaE (UPF0421/DUF939 family)
MAMMIKIGNRLKLYYWVARLAASDPGFVRLHFAIKIVLTIFVACLVMLIGLQLGSQTNITPIMLTGLVALQANVLVNDGTVPARKVTTRLFPFSCALSITIATTATHIGYHLADLILVLIVFLTFYLQKFGVRHFTLGMIGFLTFYFSLMYMRNVVFSQLLWFYAGILVATASAYLVNFILFKEQPNKRLLRSMTSYHIQAKLVLNQIIESIRGTKPNRKEKKKSILILNEYVRTVVSLSKSYNPSKVWPNFGMNELSTYLFNTTMLLELLSIASGKLRVLEVKTTVNVRNLLLQIAQSLKDVKVLEGKQNGPLENLRYAIDMLGKELKALELVELDNQELRKGLDILRRVEHTAIKVMDEITIIQQKHTCRESNKSQYSELKQDRVEPSKKTMEGKQMNRTLGPSTKKGLQAAFASAAAIVIGHLISPSYPYWALLAVNMVTIGTETSRRAVTKATERIIGTIAGAIVGVIAVQFVYEHPYVIGMLLMISVFMAYYLMALSYSIFIFWVTLLLTMAFGLMNVPSIENVLIIRVLDTIIGVILGACAAIFIMPHRTIDKIKNSVNEYIKDLKEFIDSHANVVNNTHDPNVLVHKALLLDQKLHLIKSEANIIKRWTRKMTRMHISKNIMILSVFNEFVKHLASLSNHETSLKLDGKIVRALNSLEKNLEENMDTVCQMLNVDVNQETDI